MADKGRKLTDRELHKLERELSSRYAKEADAQYAKLRKQLKMFEALDKRKQSLVNKGSISQDEYDEWRKKELIHGRWMSRITNDLAHDMLNINQKTADLINESADKVYLQNRNNSLKDIESKYGSEIKRKIVKRKTVERIRSEGATMIPEARINEAKDLRWNKQKLNSMIMQSAHRGESVEQMSERLSRVVTANQYSAIRSARTMITGSENSALLDSYRIARDEGVPIKKVWRATLDERTRASHVELNGEVREIEERFSNGLMFPGDMSGAAKEVFNCRCKLEYVIENTPFLKRLLRYAMRLIRRN